MKVTKTKTYDVSFSVQYFEPNEGGMGHDQYGHGVGTLEAALDLLDQALAVRPQESWIIVLDVETKVTP